VPGRRSHRTATIVPANSAMTAAHIPATDTVLPGFRYGALRKAASREPYTVPTIRPTMRGTTWRCRRQPLPSGMRPMNFRLFKPSWVSSQVIVRRLTGVPAGLSSKALREADQYAFLTSPCRAPAGD
jgi:hypothetical protein